MNKSYFNISTEESKILFFKPKKSYVIDIGFCKGFNKYEEFDKDMAKFYNSLRKYGFKNIDIINRRPVESWAGPLHVNNEEDPYTWSWKIKLSLS